MPANYQNLGVEFLYPENWTLTDEQATGWPRSMSLQMPDGGFFVLQIHPASSPFELAEEVLKTMKEEYASVEAEPASELLEGHELVGFDLHFYYLDLIIAARVRAVLLADQTYVWFFQAEDQEFDRLTPVFLAIETGLMRSLAGREAGAPPRLPK